MISQMYTHTRGENQIFNAHVHIPMLGLSGAFSICALLYGLKYLYFSEILAVSLVTDSVSP